MKTKAIKPRKGWGRFILACFLVTTLFMPLSMHGTAVARGTVDTTTLITTGSSGIGGNSTSFSLSVSDDGTKMVFQSFATDLTDSPTDDTQPNIFLYDTGTGVTTLITAGASGIGGNGYSCEPSISADGKKIAFVSSATDLIDGSVTNGESNIFIYDVETGVTTLMTTGASGQGGDSASGLPTFSLDGTKIAFYSHANDLIDGLTTSYGSNIFVYDTETGNTTLVTKGTSGVGGNNWSTTPSISAGGEKIAFESRATDLISGSTTNGETNIFIYDFETGITTLITAGVSGQGGNANSYAPSISVDGTKVAFQSHATDLISGSTSNGETNIFVYDFETGVTTLMTTGASGQGGDSRSSSPTFSSDGTKIAFTSHATDLISGSTTNSEGNIFVYDFETGVTTLMTTGASGQGGNANSYDPSISVNGSKIAFTSHATDLISGSTTNSEGNIFYWSQTTTCDVGFDAQNGSVVATETVVLGDMVTEPTQPSRAGFRFAGWWSDPTNGTQWDFANDTVDDDMMLYAHWTENGKPYVTATLSQLTVLKRTSLTQEQYLQAIGAKAFNAEGTPLPLSAITITNWENFKFNQVNWPNGGLYTIELSVTDNDATSDPYEVGLYVMDSGTILYPVQPNNPNGQNLPTPPEGYKWAQDKGGNIVMVPSGLSLSAWETASKGASTGDALPIFALVGILSAILARIAVRKKDTE